MKRKNLFLSVLIGAVFLFQTGCGNGSDEESSAENLTEDAAVFDTEEEDIAMTEAEKENSALEGDRQDQEKEAGEEEEAGEAKEEIQGESGKEAGSEIDESIPKEVPQLPETGAKLADFVPEGWELLDSVELDFNEDDITDYVGVLQWAKINRDRTWWMSSDYPHQKYPRILFAIRSDGAEKYRLDFQDINLIYAWDEGGVFGDPYLPLTAEGASFTTHTYGGSAWRWSEDCTYVYREETWWLALSEKTYGYYEYTTDYEKNDWESGVGIRKKRSSEPGDIGSYESANGEELEPVECDVEYKVSLDESMTLEQAGKRGALAGERVSDWEVEKIVLAEGVELSEDRIELPGEAFIRYCDENCALYTFGFDSDTGRRVDYLAMYCWQDKSLSVLAGGETAIDAPKIYDGKIYYTSDIVEHVKYKTMEDGTEQIAEEEAVVGVKLNRMDLDGSGKETIFEYRYQEATQEIMESRMHYLGLYYEISGGEIVAQVRLGNEPHPFYRMKTDGSRREKIGQMLK